MEQINFRDKHSAAKLHWESKAVNQISPHPIFEVKMSAAKAEPGAVGGAWVEGLGGTSTVKATAAAAVVPGTVRRGSRGVESHEFLNHFFILLVHH